jgi:hypothetical protein
MHASTVCGIVDQTPLTCGKPSQRQWLFLEDGSTVKAMAMNY